MSDDPYVYPGTEVLRNHFGIRDTDQLQTVERRLTRARGRQPLPAFAATPEGYRVVHRHLFQDVYPWAGEYRTCQLGKPFWFEEAKNIERRMREQFARLETEDHLRGLKPQAFAQRAAEHLCELNDIHPFREGNGRTNRMFAQQLAAQAGYRLNLEKIHRDRWMEASLAGFHRTDFGLMADVLERALDGRTLKRNLGRGR